MKTVRLHFPCCWFAALLNACFSCLGRDSLVFENVRPKWLGSGRDARVENALWQDTKTLCIIFDCRSFAVETADRLFVDAGVERGRANS